MGHPRPLFGLFFVFSKQQIIKIDNLFEKILPMTGFEVEISSFGSDRSIYRTITIMLIYEMFQRGAQIR